MTPGKMASKHCRVYFLLANMHLSDVNCISRTLFIVYRFPFSTNNLC